MRAVLLADATYELRGTDGRPVPSPALVALVDEAASSGEQFVLMTASSAANNLGGVAQPSGAETLERIVRDVEARGRTFEEDTLDGLDLHPRRGWRAGANVRLYDFGDVVRHEQHATMVAPKLWPGLLQPWVDARSAQTRATESTAGSGADGPGSRVGVGAIGVGALLALWWWRRRGQPARSA